MKLPPVPSIALLALVALFTLVSHAGAAPKPSPNVGIYPVSEVSEAEGFVISLHGGGWRGDRPEKSAYRMLRGLHYPARRAGFVVVNVAYSTGAAEANREILQVYRDLLEYGKPICFMGNSAGGNLALIAAIRVQADCVVANSAPTDLPRWDSSVEVRDPAAIDAYLFTGFGKDSTLMKRWSPIRFVKRITFPVLYSGCAVDTVVPASFGDSLARASSQVRRLKLTQNPAGSRWFSHCRTTVGEIARYSRAVIRMLSSLAT